MVARKAGRNLRGRDAGSRRALGGHSGEVDLWDDTRAPFRTTDQRGPGRTGAGTGPGTAEDLWGEGDAVAGADLEDCGGSGPFADPPGGRGLARLVSFEAAACARRAGV